MLTMSSTKRIGNEKKRDETPSFKCNINELPVNLVGDELEAVIKVIKPSRASLVCERME